MSTSSNEHNTETSLKDLILKYQSTLQSSCNHSTQITNNSLELLSKFQNFLRQSSILYNAICKYDPEQLCALLLSGNIVSMTKNKKPHFTRAFPNQSFVNQSTYLIQFLRENLHFTATLFFKAIQDNLVDAKFVSFSTIPTLFQNGWCVEEDLLWSTFLTCFLCQMDAVKPLDPNSPLFYPFKAFFIQKLSLDYFQITLAPDLQSFIDDKDISALRVNFDFDAVHMMPTQYINRISKAASNIMQKMSMYLSIVPLSVRRLLAQISATQLVINYNTYNDLELANFFFINCCLLPAISEPHMIGLDAAGSPQFVFDDLANLFFFSNYMNLRFHPPFVFTMTAVLDSNQFKTKKLVNSLIETSNSEPVGVFYEALIQQASDRYQKTVTFMPLDLYLIHLAFVQYSESLSSVLNESGQKSLKSLDYLLTVKPEVIKEQQYNMFTQTMKMPHLTPTYVPTKLTSAERCFKTVFSNLSVTSFDSLGPLKAMEFELTKSQIRKDTEFSCALELTLDIYKKDEGQIINFLKTQIENLNKTASADNELAIDIQLQFSDLKNLAKRTLLLCTRLTSAAIRMLIHYLIKNYCLQRIAHLDGHKQTYTKNAEPFFELYNEVLETCRKEIENNVTCDKVDAEMKENSLVQFKNILFFTLLDRISISSFIESRDDQREIITTMINQMKWKSNPKVQDALAYPEMMADTSDVNILMRGVELMIGAVSSSTISLAVHLILNAISTVVSAISKKSDPEKLGCVMWVVLHSNIEALYYIYKFIGHFYSSSIHLVDICGNENVKYWIFFTKAFQLLGYEPRLPLTKHFSSSSDLSQIYNSSLDIDDSLLFKQSQPKSISPKKSKIDSNLKQRSNLGSQIQKSYSHADNLTTAKFGDPNQRPKNPNSPNPKPKNTNSPNQRPVQIPKNHNDPNRTPEKAKSLNHADQKPKSASEQNNQTSPKPIKPNQTEKKDDSPNSKGYRIAPLFPEVQTTGDNAKYEPMGLTKKSSFFD